MINILISWALVAFAVSFIGTVAVKRIAVHFDIVDRPLLQRKIHRIAVPWLGGIAIYVAVASVIIILLFTTDFLTSGEITQQQYWGFLLGGLILMIGGFFDDRFELSPSYSIWFPILAAITVIVFGIEVEKLTNPFGGVLYLSWWQSDLLVFTWLMIVMYTTKFLDGLDGLATSVTTVGSLMILLLALTVSYYQPDVALLSAISIGALFGFLFWNFHPASIFLGEGGSTFVGFLLGTLAVISGGKLATALLVLGIPFLDLIWVVVRRYVQGGVHSIFRGDRKHLHHRLLDLHWGQRRIVFLYVFLATLFGITTLFFQSKEKLVALIVLGVMMFLAALYLVQKEKQE